MVVQIIDDSKDSRESFQELFEEIDLKSNSLEKIDTSLEEQLNSFSKDDFIISDFKLKNHSPNYSKFNGDIIISEAYKNHIPGILCSSYVSRDLGLSRVIKRYIPKIIRTQLLSQELYSPDYILKTKKLICDEFKNIYTKERRPWRALLRTVDYDADQKTVYVEIPSWEPDTKLSIPLSDFPEEMKNIVIHDSYRFHAIVNLDCEEDQDLYICKIEDK